MYKERGREGIKSPTRVIIFLSQIPNRFWGPHSLLFNRYRGSFLGIDFDHLPSRSCKVKMSGAICFPLSPMPSWRWEGHLYPYLSVYASIPVHCIHKQARGTLFLSPFSPQTLFKKWSISFLFIMCILFSAQTYCITFTFPPAPVHRKCNAVTLFMCTAKYSGYIIVLRYNISVFVRY